MEYFYIDNHQREINLKNFEGEWEQDKCRWKFPIYMFTDVNEYLMENESSHCSSCDCSNEPRSSIYNFPFSEKEFVCQNEFISEDESFYTDSEADDRASLAQTRSKSLKRAQSFEYDENLSD